MNQNLIEIDIEQLRNDVNNKLEDSGWAPMLSPFINGLEFDMIMNKLVECVNAEKRFTPRFKDIFNAFLECPYDELKCIIIGQDPYPQLGVADGIAFSCSRKGKAEKSLQYINKAIGTDHTDLRCWANQGVLLINTAFTVEINSIGSHYSIWKPFTEYLFENINRHNKQVPSILMGKKAEAWQLLLDRQKIFKVAHPASAAYRGGEWDCKDVFNKVNTELENQGKLCIDW
jgi:uracil-DNA glycosylase